MASCNEGFMARWQAGCFMLCLNLYACWPAVYLQYKMDEDGANIGILFDNRVRPQQYSKPGAGMGGGLSLNTL